MLSKNQPFKKFHANQLSSDQARKITGGFGASAAECARLEQNLDEAVASGNQAAIRRALNALYRSGCFDDGF
ncbi:MAG TPA: hypothetical protein DCS93_07885 [Microscillaceae bacterium]|nr:hypothetical protein [Microscillaceae bacterium]